MLRPPTGRLPDHVRGRDDLVAHLRALARAPDGRTQAEQEFRDLLADRLRLLGPDHPSTLNTRYGLAGVLEASGRYDQARQELRDLLADRLRALGPDHPDTRITRESLIVLERRTDTGSDTGR